MGSLDPTGDQLGFLGLGARVQSVQLIQVSFEWFNTTLLLPTFIQIEGPQRDMKPTFIVDALQLV